MDIIADPPVFEIDDSSWRIFSRNPVKPPHYAAKGAKISNSAITEGCEIYGTVKHSILFEGVTVGRGAIVEDSILFPGAVIGENCTISKTIIGNDTVISNSCTIGDKSIGEDQFKSKYCSADISLIGGGLVISEGTKIGVNAMVKESI